MGVTNDQVERACIRRFLFAAKAIEERVAAVRSQGGDPHGQVDIYAMAVIRMVKDDGNAWAWAVRATSDFIDNGGYDDEAEQRAAVARNELGVLDGMLVLEAMTRVVAASDLWRAGCDFSDYLGEAVEAIDDWGTVNSRQLAQCENALCNVLDEQWFAWHGNRIYGGMSWLGFRTPMCGPDTIDEVFACQPALAEHRRLQLLVHPHLAE